MRGQDAGIRTHMLVALGAAAMTIIAFELYDALQARHQDVAGDPLRVIEGVITAVGFFGRRSDHSRQRRSPGLDDGGQYLALRCGRPRLRRGPLYPGSDYLCLYRR